MHVHVLFKLYGCISGVGHSLAWQQSLGTHAQFANDGPLLTAAGASIWQMPSVIVATSVTMTVQAAEYATLQLAFAGVSAVALVTIARLMP